MRGAGGHRRENIARGPAWRGARLLLNGLHMYYASTGPTSWGTVRVPRSASKLSGTERDTYSARGNWRARACLIYPKVNA